MAWLIGSIAAVGTIALFFWWATRSTAKQHARFDREDVDAALSEFVSPETRYYDDWDLFLAWPIANPRLEAIRQECIRIISESPSEFGEEAMAKVAAVLARLRNGTSI